MAVGHVWWPYVALNDRYGPGLGHLPLKYSLAVRSGIGRFTRSSAALASCQLPLVPGLLMAAPGRGKHSDKLG